MAVTRDRTQRIKYCRAVVGKSIEMSIRDRPEDGLQSVEAGGEQGGTTHYHDEDASGMRLAHKPVENLVGGLVDQPQTEDVDDHGQNDQWYPPCPVRSPDSRVSIERSERKQIRIRQAPIRLACLNCSANCQRWQAGTAVAWPEIVSSDHRGYSTILGSLWLRLGGEWLAKV